MHTRSTVQLASVLGLLCLLLALAETQFHFLRSIFDGGPSGHRELATRFLGQYLATQYPGKQADALSNPFSMRPRRPQAGAPVEKPGLLGTRRGFGLRSQSQQGAFSALEPSLRGKPHAGSSDPISTT